MEHKAPEESASGTSDHSVPTTSAGRPATLDHVESPDGAPRERHNFVILILHQVCFRAAWIFKTESVVMPAFLDSISSTGWVRGMLPPLNRLGQSLTPMIFAGLLADTPVKSHWLPRTTTLMGIPFLLLGGLLIVSPAGMERWLPFVFLTLYCLFFCIHGLNQAVYNTVQGKLIAAQRRGRLVAIAGYVGSLAAVLSAWFIMQSWVTQSPPAFARIFLFTGGMFLTASLVVRRLIESADVTVERVIRRPPFHESLICLREDPHLRRLCLLSVLIAFSMVIFPHYQRIGRQMTGYEGRMLMVWVISQNLGAAAYSWIAGRLADRHGTRSALQLLGAANVVCPLIPLVLRMADKAEWFWITFVFLGTLPVMFRMQSNYALELTDRSRHPIYLSTCVLCAAPPILLAPVAGEIVERAGYALPFCFVAGVSFVAWLLTLRMIEPRDRNRESAAI